MVGPDNEFQGRLDSAQAFEAALIEHFNEHETGWHAEPFGQGQLSETAREMLRDHGTLLRWMPDIIAFAPSDKPPGHELMLIDAKTSCPSYENPHYNYDVEEACVDAGRHWQDMFNLTCYYIFSDFKVLSVNQVKCYGIWHKGTGRGSGTPYLRVDKSFVTDHFHFDNWKQQFKSE